MQNLPNRLRVLVFNWHEPYICLFARTGHSFHVAPPAQRPDKKWNSGFRPLPENVAQTSWKRAEEGVRRGEYDLVLCLTLQDVQTVQGWQVPRLFVMLNMIGTDAGVIGAEKEAFVERLRPLFEQVDIAFISEKKRRDWGWQAPVVVSGIDPAEYGGYRGELARVLRVGNMLRERDHMQGFSIQEEILGNELPSTILGVNPTLPQSRASQNWEDLLEQYRRHRVLLNTLTEGHEDGYNLAVLEAMATGMPVVSLANSSSPIVDGYNGFVSEDRQYLREKVRLLLEDGELAAELGRRARQTVVEKFHIRECAARWNEVFAACVEKGRAPLPGAAPRAEKRRLKILLAAPANPLSTSSYYERALRRGHEVLTCGPQLDEQMLGQWKAWEDQHALKDPGAGDRDKMGLLKRLVRPCDVPLPWGQIDAGEVAGRLPQGWRPDLVLWIDAGPEFRLVNPGHFGCPSVCLMGDTHTRRDWRLDYAAHFDRVYLSFARQDIPAFRECCSGPVGWLPAACEPEIHRRFRVDKAYDIVFVGQTLSQWHGERVRLLERLLQEGLDVRVDSRVLEEMSLLLARGRIAFNRSLNGDLNMRVFEALATGTMLLTDRLPEGAGLEELFADGEHLVLYSGEQDLVEKARYYLEHEAERERIAEQGHGLALARHTYGHRADALLADVFGEGVCAPCLAPAPAPQAPAEKTLPAYYRNTRPEVAALVPGEARRVLEVGCAAGEMGRALKEERPGLEVVGIEYNEEAAGEARSKLDAVIRADLEALEFLPYPEGYFDCVVCADVLEHLRQPEQVLRRLLPYLGEGGHLVCSIPNIRHQSVLLDLLGNGRWRYQDEGLLDRTHLRFFTLTEIRQMLADLGLDMEELSASQSPPMEQMEPLVRAVGELGGDAEALRREARIIQYLFRATRQKAAPPGGGGAQVRVSIVVPLFNKAEYTEKCFYALAENTGGDPDYEVVVVDNGSSDWTRYLLAAFEGDVRVLRNDENVGFARANNQGAGVATGEYLVFLNNDTVPQPGWLEAMVSLADADPQIGIVGAKLLYPGTRQVQHAGIELIDGIPDHVFRHADADDPRVDQVRDVDMVTGACMLVRRALFAELGGFDAGYVNGVEDVDLCLRAREKGYRVVYCPASVVEHHEGTSEGRFDHVRENLQRFYDRWSGRFDAQGRFVAAPGGGKHRVRSFRGNWEGSFFQHASLAHVNRELVLALLGTGRCELGLVPRQRPQFGVEEDPDRFPALQKRLGQPLSGDVDFHLRHTWPPDFKPPPEGRLILLQPWEYGRVPRSWIEPLRGNVDQVWVPTRYVRQCFLDSGVEAGRVVVVPQGIDPERFRPGVEKLDLPTEKSFRFLFVGGTLSRKGIDLLLEVYRDAFRRADDVCLVIKDMGSRTFYKDQNASAQIRALQEDPDAPEILYLEDDLRGAQMPALYAACDCLVHPYRGEGFGLPVAEAMACGLPVIVTRGGACDDFCAEDTAFLLVAERRPVRFEEETVGQAWFLEPDRRQLAERLSQIYRDPEAARRTGARASAHIRENFTWARGAEKALEALEALERLPERTASAVPVAVRQPALVVLGGQPLPAARLAELGLRVKRYDLELVERLGEQLDAVSQDGEGEFLAVLAPGALPAPGALKDLVQALHTHARLGLVGAGGAPGEGLQEVAFPEAGCLLVRREALVAVGGFDPSFRTRAVFAQLARQLRRAGWQVGQLRGCALESQGEGDDRAAEGEEAAVRALEEGDGLRAAGKGEEALAAYRRAIAAKGDFVEPIVVLASCLMEAGRPLEAARELERLVRLDERSPRAHNYLGLALYQGREWEGARQSFKRALELDSDNVEVLVNLSVLEWGQEEGEQALDYLERAAALEPANRDVILNTALIHGQMGNVQEALRLLSALAQRDSGDVEVLGLLADILVQSEELEEARQVAERILHLRPGHARARAILESASGEEGQEKEK